MSSPNLQPQTRTSEDALVISFEYERRVRAETLKEEFEYTGSLLIGNLWPGDLITVGLGEEADRDSLEPLRRINFEVVEHQSGLLRVAQDVVVGAGWIGDVINLASFDNGSVIRDIVRPGRFASFDLSGNQFKDESSVTKLNDKYLELVVNNVGFF